MSDSERIGLTCDSDLLQVAQRTAEAATPRGLTAPEVLAQVRIDGDLRTNVRRSHFPETLMLAINGSWYGAL